MMDFNTYLNKKLAIEYMQKYMSGTLFKNLEILEIKIEKTVTELLDLYEKDETNVSLLNKVEKIHDFFEHSPIDFKVSSIIDFDTMRIHQDVFNKRLNFIMYDIYDLFPPNISNSFYHNVYLNDLVQPQILSLEHTKILEIDSDIDIAIKVSFHYIKQEAYRTAIYLFQNNSFTTERKTKLLNNITTMMRTMKENDQFFHFLNILQSSIETLDHTLEYKKSYEKLKNKNIEDIEYILADIIFEEKQLLSDEAYSYLKIPKNIYDNEQYLLIKNKVLDNIQSLVFDCILVDYCEDVSKQFINLKKGFEIGFELIALSIQIKKAHSNKKKRAEEFIAKKYHENVGADLEIIKTLYYFNEHNAHHILFLIIPLSHYLALTYEESFKVLQALGFYLDESANYKNGTFKKHFTFLQQAYNSNFAYLT